MTDYISQLSDEQLPVALWTHAGHFKYLEHHWGCLFEWELKYPKKMLDELTANIKIENIVDIGSNTGSASCYLAVTLNPKLVVMIEPDELNYRYSEFTSKGISGGSPTETARVNCAVYYSDQKYMNMIDLCSADGNSNSGGKFLEDVAPMKLMLANENKFTLSKGNLVELKTLEYITSQLDIQHADLIKIDVEGAEWNIIKNSSFLREKTNLIFLEYHDRSLEETLDFLKINLPHHDVIRQIENSVILKHKG